MSRRFANSLLHALPDDTIERFQLDLDYRRGHMKILDRSGLETKACECYGIIKKHLDSYTTFNSDIVA